ncbi:Protein of unknown function [Alkalispirochaeta americana]|uniref:Transport system permease protein n=1 Tax=Alkalispirochaeta americana TaxID=159291 RepID=A0A1N6XQZ9_9SPIO|nr:YhfT family protein [Alkalispirochaeta americana]SIR04750.1 Protein of unknown function [Alkalispirochaeta americana]
MNYVIIGLLGALTSVLANRGIAVFNDGLRPVLPEYLEGRMDKKSLAATSFALSFGLVIGFGIPFSIGKSIMLIHCVLLGTDIIGTWSPKDKKLGMIVSGTVGALYGIFLVVGLQVVVDLFAMLPFNFLGPLGKVGDPIVAAFALFPVLVVAYQYGMKKGIITFAITIAGRQFFEIFGKFSINGNNVSLNPDGMALFISMLIMLVFAIREKKSDADAVGANTQLLGLFGERVNRIKKNVFLLAPMGGLVAAATSATIIAGDPISLNLLNEGLVTDAGFVALARALGFIPLIATTAIATGVYSPVGMTFVFVAGIFITNPLLAFVVGLAVIFAEVYLLAAVARLLDRFPGVRACADHIRTAMGRVLEVALLLGGAIAANSMVPKLGFFFVIGVWLMNKNAKKPMVSMAVGPIAAILFGLLVNILMLVGLIQLPA